MVDTAFGATVPSGLLRLHRHGLVNVLVVARSRRLRLALAAEFHHASVLRSGPMVAVDCESDAGPIERALLDWSFGGGAVHPLWGASRGTLVLDRVTRLAPGLQELLYHLVRRGGSDAPGGFDGWGRLVTACEERPERAVARGAFSAALLDSLDKVRVDGRAGRVRGAA